MCIRDSHRGAPGRGQGPGGDRTVAPDHLRQPVSTVESHQADGGPSSGHLQQQQPALCQSAPDRLGCGATVDGGCPGAQRREPRARGVPAEGETMIDPTPTPDVAEDLGSGTDEPPAGETVMRLQDVAVAFAGRAAERSVSIEVHPGAVSYTHL